MFLDALNKRMYVYVCYFYISARLLPGTVKVTAWTNASDFLGETYFTYHAKMPPKEVKQLLYNPNQLSSFFGSLAEQFGFSEENECSVGDSYSSINVQDPGKKENFS